MERDPPTIVECGTISNLESESSATASTFLIRRSDSSGELGHCEEDQVCDRHVNSIFILMEELIKIILMMIPALASQLVERSILTVPVISVGHLSTTDLAGISLGSITASVTGLSILQGFVSWLDTYLAAAWTSQPMLVGLLSQRTFFLMTIIQLPILLIWFKAETILLAIGEKSDISRIAAEYLRIFSFGLPAYSFNLISRRYLQAQGKFIAQTCLTCFGALINLFLNYLLVWGPDHYRLGYKGAPISSVISYNIVALTAVIYCTFFTHHTAWHPISRQAITNLGEIGRLGISGIGQIAPEWWAWEIVSLEASRLGNDALATQSILITSSATLYQIPAGLSNAAAMRVGNLLGLGQGRRAGIVANMSILLILMFSCITSAFLLGFRHSWAYMFTSDPSVVKKVASVIPIIALYQLGEGNTAITSVLLRCKGEQLIGAAVSISSYYGVAIPLGYILAFRWKFGLQGLWIGLSVSLIYGAFLGTFLCLKTDWNIEIKKVKGKLDIEKSMGEKYELSKQVQECEDSETII